MIKNDTTQGIMRFWRRTVRVARVSLTERRILQQKRKIL